MASSSRSRVPSAAGSQLRLLLSSALLCIAFQALAVAQSPLVVTGSVVDDDGAPIGGATVELFPLLSRYQRALALFEPPPEPRAAAAADQDGAFELAVPEAGMWRLVARADGFAAEELELAPMIYGQHLRPIRLYPSKRRELRVLDTEGQPVAGALVVARYARPGFLTAAGAKLAPTRGAQVAVRSGADGRVAVAVTSDDTLHWAVSAPGFLPSAEPPTEEDIVQLEAGSARELRLTDTSGQPLAQAVVSSDGAALARSNADGTLEIAVPRTRALAVRVLGDGHRTAAAEITVGEEPRRIVVAGPVLVRGTVRLERSSQRVGGAWVWLDDPGGGVRSDARGRFELAVDATTADGDATKSLSGKARGTFRGSVALSAESLRRGATPTLELRPAGRIEGRVVDAQGRAVESADVALQAENDQLSPVVVLGTMGVGGPSGGGRSDGEGRFALSQLEIGMPYTLVVRKPGYSPAKTPVLAARADEVVSVTVELRAGRSAWGTVVDEADQPVLGAEVRLHPSPRGLQSLLSQVRDAASDAAEYVAETNERGRFQFADVEDGTFDLEASASGFGPLTVPGISIAPEDGEVEIGTVQLLPGVELEGRVTDQDGAPLTGASVRVRRHGGVVSIYGGPNEEQPAPDAVSDRDGYFAVSDLAEGTKVSLDVDKEGFVRASLDSLDVPGQLVEIELAPASTLRGVVVDVEGKPIGAAQVMLRAEQSHSMLTASTLRRLSSSSRRARSDEAGRFAVDGLGEGRWELSVAHHQYQQAITPGIEVRSGEDPEPVRVVLREGAVLVGTVVGPSGAPVAGARVQTSNQGDFTSLMSFRSTGPTASDGSYRMEGLSVGGTTFTVQHPDYPSQVRDAAIVEGTNRLDFRLEAGLEITGRVVGEDGLPVTGALVQAENPTGSAGVIVLGGRGPERAGQGSSGEDGGFTLKGLTSGVYRVTASKAGYAPSAAASPVRLDSAPVSGVEVVLDQGAAIVGTVSGLPLEQLAGVQILAVRTDGAALPAVAQVDYEGRYRLEHLSYGDWSVSAHADGGRNARAAVTLEPGTTEHVVDLDLGGGLRLSGRIVRAGGSNSVGSYEVMATGKDVAGGASTATDPEGRFVIENLTPGVYTLRVRGLSGVFHEQEVELRSDRDIEIVLTQARVAGAVVDAETEQPIAGATVVLRLLRQDNVGGFNFAPLPSTDGSGRFVFSDVPQGTYRIEARSEGYAAGTIEVAVQPEQDISDLVIRLTTERGLILRVVQPTGSPVQGRVNVAALSGEHVLYVKGYSPEEGGRVRLEDLPAGSWTLLLEAPGYGAVELSVEVPRDPLAVALPESGALRVVVPALEGSPRKAELRIYDPRGRRYRTPEFAGIVDHWSFGGGLIVLREVPAGAWRVEVVTGDGSQRWQNGVVVEPNATADLVLN